MIAPPQNTGYHKAVLVLIRATPGDIDFSCRMLFQNQEAGVDKINAIRSTAGNDRNKQAESQGDYEN